MRLDTMSKPVKAGIISSVTVAIAGCVLLIFTGASSFMGASTIDPSGPPRKLDLSDYRLTFDDEFNTLNIVADGVPGGWYAPKHAKIGSTTFDPPGENGPFFIKKGKLIIRATKENGEWHSGLLQTVDSRDHGFAQQYGYFEMRAKFPANALAWPAFWLLNQNLQSAPGVGLSEIDAIEGNGDKPNTAFLHANLTPCFYCSTRGRHWVKANLLPMQEMYKGYHRYGVMIDPSWVTYYIDGKAVFQIATLEDYKTPFYALIDLATQDKPELDTNPNPKPLDMVIDYVRIYAKK